MISELGTLISFPVRRVCVLGVPPQVITDVRVRLTNVALSADASTLQRSDLLVVGIDEPNAFDIIRWVRLTVPDFPILFWSAASGTSILAEHCRLLLFGPDEESAAASPGS